MNLKYLKLLILSVVINVCLAVANNGMEKSKRSFVIIFDVTGSMGEEIEALRKGVLSLLDYFHNQPDNPIANYIFIQFRDDIMDPDIIPPIVESKYSEIVNKLNSFSLNNGQNWDCPESCFSGIKRGLDLANDDSLVFVFTDASANDKQLEPDILRLIQIKRATIYFFLTGRCDYSNFGNDYHNIATSSNGLVFELHHSQIEEHFPQYREVINDKLGLGVVTHGPAGRSNIDVNVDSSMKEFTLTVVANEPSITIYDPDNNPTNDFKLLTDLPTIKMIKVEDPEPGKWTVQLKATSPYTGQVSVISDLSFKYGFAVHEPDSIGETSFSPLIGQNNYLAISPSNSSLIHSLKYVVLDTKSGQLRFPLRKKIGTDGDLYITESIQLPKDPFKVQLEGIDPENHIIKRLLSPDIASRQPDKPVAAVVPKINVHEGEPIYLICRVDSMVNISISWRKVDQPVALTSMMSKQSNILNHTIAESKISDGGVYICSARNSAGITESKTIVNVRHTTRYRVKLGDRLVLECPIDAVKHIKMDIAWFQNGSRILQSSIVNNRLIIDKLDHVHNGKYKCQSQNKRDTKEVKFNIDVFYEPKILNIIKRDDRGSEILRKSSTTLDIFNSTTISLTCIVSGNPPPVAVWKKNGIIFSNMGRLDNATILINTTNSGFSALYECSAQNELSSDVRAIELIEIIRPKLSRYSSRQNLIENKEFRLTCPVEPGDYDVTWYFNDTNFDKHKQSDGSLFIEKVYTNMKGRAYCVATNKAGTVVATFNFDVLRPPYGLSATTSSYKNRIQTISPNLKQITLIKNEPLDITCNARGNPNPNIFWMKNHRLYSRDKTIEIRSVVPTDGATYICVAQNTLGNQTEKIDVIVRIPPSLLTNNVNKLGVTVLQRVQVPDTYFKADNEQIITTNEGEKVLLDCNMGGNPRPTFEWFKNNEYLNEQTPILEFTSARVEDSGIYKCIGDTNYGIIFYLNVQKPISIISATSTKPVYEKGDEIKLICKTKGNQLPVIVWRGNGDATDNGNIFKPNADDFRKEALQQDEPLYLNGKQIIKLSDVGPLERYGKISYEFVNGEYIGTLEYVIKSAKLRDAGQYKCISHIYKIKNTQIVKSVDVKVVVAPYFENAKTEYRIWQGIGSPKIKCPIKGIPYPKIEWYRGTFAIKSNHNFDIETNSLVLKSPMPFHAGEYSCRGTNQGGSVEYKFQVNILKHIADISNVVLNRSHRRKLEVEKYNTIVLECSIKVTPTYWLKIVDAYPTKQLQRLVTNATYNFYANTSNDIMCSSEPDPEYGEIFEITVLEKPTIRRPIEKMNVKLKLNDILRLQCDATGEPKPTIKWYKYELGHPYNIENYSQFEVYGETLMKRHAENSDTAKYLCTAQNKLGEDSHIIEVTVLNNSHYSSSWSDWSPCTKTCGLGTQFRYQYCIHGSCFGTPQREIQNCTTVECAVDGGWSDFSPFDECSKTCLTDLNEPPPMKIARRECNNPMPAAGGKNCIGSALRIVNCSVPLCESVFGRFLDYSACSNQSLCCPAEFKYDNKTESCIEIDKCKRRGPHTVCRTNSQKCRNIGADDYECVCRTGFKLKLSLKKTNDPKKNPNCVDLNECKEGPYPCGLMKCSNTIGSFKCLTASSRRV